jgi:enolase
MLIKEVIPKIINNSRNEKTIQLTIKTLKGSFTASSPYGKSKGKYETPAYNERGIEFSIRLLKEFSFQLKNKNFSLKKFDDLKDIEEKIINFENEFGKLGANITYALETGILKAAAKENEKELWDFILEDKEIKIPMPIGNCIGGGKHTHSPKKPDFQEFLLIPHEKTFSKAFTKMFRAYETAKSEIKALEKKWIVQTNDEKAWQTNLSNELCLDILKTVSDKYCLRIGVDLAASSFFNKTKKEFNYHNKEINRNSESHLEYINMLIQRYDLFYLEDPMDEEDFFGFSRLISFKNNNTLIVGDDLTVTHLDRIKKAVAHKCINAIIIKPNQNGYLLKVKEAVEFSRKNNLKIIFSHRSGETMDDALADYAVGFRADFIKTGINGKERLIKLKRMIDIEKSVGLG